jgi:hypothetical protein
MSAFISHAYADRISILTDGAFFQPDGTIVHLAKKVEILPNHNIAITGRGSSLEFVASVISQFIHLSGNEASKFSTDDMLDVIRAGFIALSDQGECVAEFLIAAWSETEGPQHFLALCHKSAPDVTPFELWSPGPGTQLSAGPVVKPSDVGATDEDLYSPDYPERFGAKLIGAMRSQPAFTPGGDKPIYAVGGRADLTVVSATGVTTKLLATWDETIGAKIDPATEAHIDPVD